MCLIEFTDKTKYENTSRRNSERIDERRMRDANNPLDFNDSSLFRIHILICVNRECFVHNKSKKSHHDESFFKIVQGEGNRFFF